MRSIFAVINFVLNPGFRTYFYNKISHILKHFFKIIVLFFKTQSLRKTLHFVYSSRRQGYNWFRGF